MLKVLWPTVATVYTLLAGIIALALIAMAWPGGALAERWFGEANRQKAMEQVLQQRLAHLAEFNGALGRVEASETRLFTEAERAHYRTYQAWINSLIGSSNAAVFSSQRPVTTVQLGQTRNALQAAETDATRLLAQVGEPPASGGNRSTAVTAGLLANRVQPRRLLPPAELPLYEERLAAQNRLAPPYFLGTIDLAIGVLVIGFGALGAAIQGLSSIAVYVGMRKFRATWMLFYLSRPFVGAGVAVGFCLVMRSGLAGVTVEVGELNLVMYAAVAMLVGLFCGQAMEKLRKVAEAVFETGRYTDSKEGDGLAILSVAPEVPGGEAQAVLVLGRGFASDLVLLVDQEGTQFQFINAERLRVELSEELRRKDELKFLLLKIDDSAQASNLYHYKKPA
jgi:hypothetical protein